MSHVAATAHLIDVQGIPKCGNERLSCNVYEALVADRCPNLRNSYLAAAEPVGRDNADSIACWTPLPETRRQTSPAAMVAVSSL